MKRLNAVLILIFIISNIWAQDTIKIQTFNWKSTNRRDTFQFPDNPNESYRKILMLYNMRCHDAAVGSGSVGCYEWDYSCNTFITDPSRTDSTLQFHPNYVISNNNASTFAYTNLPSYVYYSYNQHFTNLIGNVLESANFSGGTSQILLSDGNKVGRIQTIFTADELLSKGLTPGPIQRMKLDILSPGEDINFFSIKLKTTNKNNFQNNTPDLTGFSPVYFRNTSFKNAGLQTFDFYQSFDWNGTDNIIVEISYSTVTGAPPVTLLAHDTGLNQTVSSYSTDGALSFSGAGNVDIPSVKFPDISNEITISFWCYGNPSIMPAQSTVLEGVDGKNARQVNIHLPWDNSNVYWDCGGSNGNYDRINKAANSTDFEGAWNYWAFTKDAVSGNMKIFLNGKLWHSGTGLKRPIDLKSLKLGSGTNGSPAYYGELDELRIWNKALDEASINGLMFNDITPAHPFYSSLLYQYSMDEEQGTKLFSKLPGGEQAVINVPNWKSLKGNDLYKNFKLNTLRPDVVFEKGNFNIQDQIIQVVDSVQNSPNRVIHYGVIGSTLVGLDTSYVYRSGAQYVYDESGAIIDSIILKSDGVINIQNLEHYTKNPSKFELLSLVTPYGNGLNLGQAGKTFTFDVTDYEPILKGKKLLSLEYGGEFQEEIDIKFLFIKGTPPAKILNIQNIWPEGRGYFNQIQTDKVFEPRQLKLNEEASNFKIKSAVTGHGQNGEFVPREHYIDINGGVQDFTYDVWKYCAKNPIFPQGGTWVFDRAGWCPGAATDVHEFYLTDQAQPGSDIVIDYGINGPDLTDANYLVSNQLISYSNFNFQNDAAIENISRPNNKAVEFERLNPACNTPTVLVKNTGAQTIQSIEFEYGIQGGTKLKYTWTGQLLPLRNIEIVLPVTSTSFWFNNGGKKIFTASITKVNGQTDDYSENNSASSSYSSVPEYSFTDPLRVKLVTNAKGADNSYTVKDGQGNILLSRNNLNNNTTYTDEINVPNGCYTLYFEDSEGDGLSFWYFPDYGSGTLKLERLLNGTTAVGLQNFNPDMGGGLQFDFVRGKVTATEDEPTGYTLLSVWPNPSSDELNIELHGFEPGKWDISIVDLAGRTVSFKSTNVFAEKDIIKLNIVDILPGMYFLNLNNGKKSWVKQVAIQR